MSTSFEEMLAIDMVLSDYEENTRESNKAMFTFLQQSVLNGTTEKFLVHMWDFRPHLKLPEGHEPYEWSDLAAMPKSEWPTPRLAYGFTITPTQFRKLHHKYNYSRLYPSCIGLCDRVLNPLCDLLKQQTQCEDLFMAEPIVFHAEFMVAMYTDVGGRDAAQEDTRKREKAIVAKLQEVLETDMPARWYWLTKKSVLEGQIYL
ncbi:hypothetical protein EUX98_g9022 [Antrodiella citrinella]|uniref:Uncharacterized protein n=1 Tax=Antrodiella citrinella TaxID=2447956 RepID=A0A4S4M0U3_9APHY|nr:hypothetical protein EUX98_g9022 [Antrodiella citrinella]